MEGAFYLVGPLSLSHSAGPKKVTQAKLFQGLAHLIALDCKAYVVPNDSILLFTTYIIAGLC